MAINIPPGSTNQGTGVNVDQIHNRGSKKTPELQTQAPQPGSDKVTLTGQAEKLQKLDDMLKSTPDVDAARVEAIKAQIADGSFKIDSADIAEKLLQSDKDLGK